MWYIYVGLEEAPEPPYRERSHLKCRLDIAKTVGVRVKSDFERADLSSPLQTIYGGAGEFESLKNLLPKRPTWL